MSNPVTRLQKANSENSQKDTLQCAQNTPGTSSSKIVNEKNSNTLRKILEESPESGLKQHSSQESSEDSDSGFKEVKSKNKTKKPRKKNEKSTSLKTPLKSVIDKEKLAKQLQSLIGTPSQEVDDTQNRDSSQNGNESDRSQNEQPNENETLENVNDNSEKGKKASKKSTQKNNRKNSNEKIIIDNVNNEISKEVQITKLKRLI